MARHFRPAALLLSAALALTSAPFGAALAQTRSIKVHSFDLDLSTKAGQAELEHRIARAIDQVCGPSVGGRMDDIMAYTSCSKSAQASAMTQYEAVVRAAHDGKLANSQTRDVIVR
jgi:UrcA family protein